jgi:hypothetical protein
VELRGVATIAAGLSSALAVTQEVVRQVFRLNARLQPLFVLRITSAIERCLFRDRLPLGGTLRARSLA